MEELYKLLQESLNERLYQITAGGDVYKRQLYNRARQGSITQELTEIIAGAQAIS